MGEGLLLQLVGLDFILLVLALRVGSFFKLSALVGRIETVGMRLALIEIVLIVWRL